MARKQFFRREKNCCEHLVHEPRKKTFFLCVFPFRKWKKKFSINQFSRTNKKENPTHCFVLKEAGFPATECTEMKFFRVKTLVTTKKKLLTLKIHEKIFQPHLARSSKLLLKITKFFTIIKISNFMSFLLISQQLRNRLPPNYFLHCMGLYFNFGINFLHALCDRLEAYPNQIFIIIQIHFSNFAYYMF